jgi:hypothetical protein
MPRYLIETTLPEDQLHEAIRKLGFTMENVAPAREMPSHRLIDADLTAPHNLPDVELRAAVTAVDGISRVWPVPDATPG